MTQSEFNEAYNIGRHENGALMLKMMFVLVPLWFLVGWFSCMIYNYLFVNN